MRKLKISFHQLPSKTNHSGYAPIYCTLSLSSAEKPIKLSTDIWLKETDWHKKQKKVKYTYTRSVALNLELTKMEQKLYSIYDDLKKMHEFPSLEMIKHVFRNKVGVKKTLLTVYNDRIEYMQKRIPTEFAPGTLDCYKSSRTVLQRFLKEVYMSSDIEINKLNEQFISSFEIFLRNKCGNSLNTSSKHCKRLQTIIRYGQRNRWFTEDPFRNHQGKTEPTNRQYLTELELQKIENLSLEGDVEVVRHLFLFMCYTGLPYAEVFTLKEQHVAIGENGKRIIDKRRGKTDLNSLIILYEKAESIIALYKDHPGSVCKGTIFPYKSNARMNDNLRIIAAKAGITKALTSHVGRHTYATLSLEHGVPMETVSKSLGHTSTKTTQIYGKITKAKIEKDYQSASFLR